MLRGMDMLLNIWTSINVDVCRNLHERYDVVVHPRSEGGESHTPSVVKPILCTHVETL